MSLTAVAAESATRKGTKKRKIVRGSEITDEVTQINCVVLKFGKEKIFKPSAEE